MSQSKLFFPHSNKFVIGLGVLAIGLSSAVVSASTAKAFYAVQSKDTAAVDTRTVDMKVKLDDVRILNERHLAAGPRIQVASSASTLHDIFESIGYRLDHVRTHGEVPRVFLASLPSDLRKISAASERKVMFIKATLPLILHVNEIVLQDRNRVLAIREQVDHGLPIVDDDAAWLAEMFADYNVTPGDYDTLLRRVDIIPPSLALAQAAEESGWGTSRFAHEGNALFGQWTFKKAGGLVPRQREEGKTHRVRAFSHLIDGVKAYVANLNRHRAYVRMREMRAEMRANDEPFDGLALAATLDRYSERGQKYIQSIQTIIRANGLDGLDRARLSRHLVVNVDRPDA